LIAAVAYGSADTRRGAASPVGDIYRALFERSDTFHGRQSLRLLAPRWECGRLPLSETMDNPSSTATD
jgi:hypothetical protein